MILLVSGGRDFDDVDYVVRHLSSFHEMCPVTQLVAGGARGVDTIAEHWADAVGVPKRVFLADWALGKKAGVLRNVQMVTEGKPNLLMAFPGGAGTAHMVDHAAKVGLDTIQFRKFFFKKESTELGFLSNFHPYPIIDEDGLYWPTTEHFYQAHKTLDETLRGPFQMTDDPAVAKRMGKSLTLRPNWEKGVKEDVMRSALRLKFASGSNMAELLLATEDHYLVERAPWDAYWGDGRDGRGKNRLGILVMERRDELRA